jgi:hypothetical protein
MDAKPEVYESRFFGLSLRVVSRDLKTVQVFTGKNAFAVEAQVSFDSEHLIPSSTESFLGSLAASMMFAILEQAKREHIAIDEIEAKLKGNVENPLSLLGVHGYERSPVLSGIRVDIYLCVDKDENSLNELCQRALKNSVLYNTLKGMDILTAFKPIV